ncbi:hypothetical protein DFH29DRAFT_222664 [Suillus ampliporus]|nr:hypothetical protein DFH29DRAFT_222664 [Suillus ampliporus]
MNIPSRGFAPPLGQRKCTLGCRGPPLWSAKPIPPLTPTTTRRSLLTTSTVPIPAVLFAVILATIIIVTTLPAVIKFTAEFATSVVSAITVTFSSLRPLSSSLPVAMTFSVAVPIIAVSVITPPAVTFFTEAVL